jgi:acetyl esterase/lipase
MRILSLFVASMVWALGAGGAEPLRVQLWPEEAPLGDGKFEKVSVPIFVHLPATNANGLAVVICPGGGYGGKVLDGEGHGIARWLNGNGIAGVVLDYRLPRGNYHRPILDAQRAIRVVRAHAKEWNLKPDRIGIMGFSAGGHLASSVGTHFDAGNPNASDQVEKLSSRPDFMVLVYPVISLGEQGHGGTRQNLLGPSPSEDLVKLFSNEKQVAKDTAPTFLTHANTDSVVPVENSRMFYAALKARQVPAELLEFPQGNHGYSGYKGPEWDAWQKRCVEWLAETLR